LLLFHCVMQACLIKLRMEGLFIRDLAWRYRSGHIKQENDKMQAMKINIEPTTSDLTFI